MKMSEENDAMVDSVELEDALERCATDADIVIAMLESGKLDVLAVEKVCAITSLHALARAYRTEGWSEERVIRPIIQKKIAFIKEAATKAQIKEILQPPKVQHTGGEVKAIGSYAIPEEELIIWSRTSLRGPLMPDAQRRYMKLFRQVFPEMPEDFGRD